MNTVTPTNRFIHTNKAKCRDCYKCVRACPVKAIKMKDGQAYIEEQKCLICGTCIKECPQNAKAYKKDLHKVKELVAKEKTAVSLAPSYAAFYEPELVNKIPTALRKIGFSYVAETAVGAYQVAKKSSEFIAKSSNNINIYSPCPAVVNYIEKYQNSLIDNLVKVESPMIVHAKMLKAELGDDYKVVFIGPCIAKKSEAKRYENGKFVTEVLTFEELNEWFQLEQIELKNLSDSEFDDESQSNAKLFPIMGGISKTAELETDIISNKTISVSGFEDLKESLDYANQIDGELIIDPLFCSHGCINGPGDSGSINIFKKKNYLIEYSKAKRGKADPKMLSIDYNAEFAVDENLEYYRISEDEINKILLKTGKKTEEDHINCGACGYATCRDKAVAVSKGMAEVEMCIPYMRKVAEQRTDKIIESSPNGVILLDENLNILHFNNSFKKLFKCDYSLVGKRVSVVLEPEPFIKILDNLKTKIEETNNHENLGIICHEIFYKLEEENQIVGIFVDITKNINDKKNLDKLKAQTILQAQELLDHQISMAQNITKFLGESTAQGELLVENLLKLTEDKTQNNDKNKWLWDMYTSK